MMDNIRTGKKPFDFIHTPPTCTMLRHRDSDSRGDFSQAECTACERRGGKCDAEDGRCLGHVFGADFVKYDEKRAVLESLLAFFAPAAYAWFLESLESYDEAEGGCDGGM